MSNGRSPSRHYCDHAECGKSFRRAEHLTRHKLNHTNSTIPCPECDRLFYRRDLLHRHLSLKHGKAPRPNRGADPDVLAPFEASSPVTIEGSSNAVLSAVNFSDPNAAVQFPAESAVIDPPVDTAIIDDAVLPMPADLFAFPSPSLDIAHDWGWLHQVQLPVLPISPNQLGQIDQNNGNGQLSLENGWGNPVSPQHLYVSHEVCEFLMTLDPIAKSNRPFTMQDTSSLLNAGFQFVLESIPIFHRPSFSFDLIQRYLCAAIFSVGLLTAQEQAFHLIGCALVGRIRSNLLQHVDKNTIYLEDLGVLQSMLLVEFCGMYLADRTAMELSDIFHGTLVTLSRRLGLFEVNCSNTSASSISTNGQDWQNSIQYESAKRLAYFVFALDVEQALLFGHERSILSAYSIKLEPPSDEWDWDVPSSGASTRQESVSSRLKFDVLCHNLLAKSHGHTLLPRNLSPFPGLVILLGLASAVLDLLRRQQDPFFDTKQALAQLASVLPLVHSRLMSGPDGPIKLHGRTIYHITMIALSTPLDDLERAANDGFSRTGRTPKQHTRTAIIRLLTKHKVRVEPAHHAIHLLKLYLIPSTTTAESPTVDAGNSMTMSLQTYYSPYEPSAIYFAMLTLWAYMIGRVGENDEEDSQMQPQSYLPANDSQLPQATGSAFSNQTPIISLLQGMETALNNGDSLVCQSDWRTVVQYAATVLALRQNSNAQEYGQVLRSLGDNFNI